MVITSFLEDFLELFAPRVFANCNMRSIELINTELIADIPQMTRRRSDIVAKVYTLEHEPRPIIVHVEIQSQIEANFSERMFHYYSLLHLEHKIPIYPIALFTHDVMDRVEPSSYTSHVFGQTLIRFEFTAIQLRHLNWRDFLLKPSPISAAFLCKMNVKRRDRPLVKSESMRMLVKLGLDHEQTLMIGRFIEAYLSLDEAEFIEYNKIMEAIPMAEKQAVTEVTTRWERHGILQGYKRGMERGLEEGKKRGLEEGLKQGLEEGLKQGLEEGLKQGLEEGLKQGQRQMLLELIESKFGSIPAEDLKLLQQLSVSELKNLGVIVLHAHSYDEFCRHLRSGMDDE